MFYYYDFLNEENGKLNTKKIVNYLISPPGKVCVKFLISCKKISEGNVHKIEICEKIEKGRIDGQEPEVMKGWAA